MASNRGDGTTNRFSKASSVSPKKNFDTDLRDSRMSKKQREIYNKQMEKYKKDNEKRLE